MWISCQFCVEPVAELRVVRNDETKPISAKLFYIEKRLLVSL